MSYFEYPSLSSTEEFVSPCPLLSDGYILSGHRCTREDSVVEVSEANPGRFRKKIGPSCAVIETAGEIGPVRCCVNSRRDSPVF